MKCCIFYLIFVCIVMYVVGMNKKGEKIFIGSVKVNMKRKKFFFNYV